MKKTPLHRWHVANGANMAEFAQYSMPLWYPQGVRKEHISVITGAGLFDTSHMAAVVVRGGDGRQLLQALFSKDLDRCLGGNISPLTDGRCVYGVFLQENGHVIDDAIVYQVRPDMYMVVVNAGMGGLLTEHLIGHGAGRNVTVSDLTDKVGKIDIQGPASAKILGKILADPQSVLTAMPYFSFKGWLERSDLFSVALKDGPPLLLSRTGYTGEFGFELFMPPDGLERVWTDLLAAGEEYGICACGLAARDSLRAGAVLPLSHQDIGDWPFAENPWPFALPLADDGTFTKSFVGADALAVLDDIPCTLPFAGFDPRKIPLGENAAVIDADGHDIGRILTCATDMAIDRINGKIVSIATREADGKPSSFQPRGLCCGFVRVDRPIKYGENVTLSDGKRKIVVEIRRDVRPDRTARKPLGQMI